MWSLVEMHLYYLIRNFAFTELSHYVSVYYLRLKNHDNYYIYKMPLITARKMCGIKGTAMSRLFAIFQSA